MPTIITSTAHLIASSGISTLTKAVQLGGPSSLTHLITPGGIGLSEKIGAFDGLSIGTVIAHPDGVSQSEKIAAASGIESTATADFLVFDANFSRSQVLFGVVGTSGTAEKFFDRGPFFFTPSEVDPNIMRDLSEAQQFLIFTQTTINTFSPFNRLPTNASIISIKGDTVFPGTLSGTHLLKTSSFANILTGLPNSSGTVSASDNINAVDAFPPFFDEEQPVRNSTFNVPTNREVSFHIKDNGSSINQGSISVFIDGVQVITAGTVLTSPTWPAGVKTVLGARDLLYTFTRGSNFSQQAKVTVSGNFADLASPAQGGIGFYQFTMLGSGTLGASITGLTDATPPSIIPLEPENLDTQISPDTHISWRLTDNAAGVNPDSVKFFLNGGLVLSHDVALEGSFSRVANTSRGFDYDYIPQHPFHFAQTVTGTIIAADFATIPNTGTLTYSFSITPDDTLSITNFFLEEGQSTLLTSGTFGSVEVIDLTYGINSTATTLLVNGEVPFGLLTTFSGAGPNRILFTWPWQNLVDFREDLLVEVHAENLFPGPFPVIKDASFLLRPGYDVFWPNKNLSGQGGPEETFPYLTNIFANTQVKNFSVNFNTGSGFIRFFTEEQAKKDLGAFLESNINVADLSAFLVALSPYFEYGKTMTLDVDVADLEGNTLNFRHVFTIEDRP